ncbi:RsmB/NOP family class I SAM-dependent RNA methyltransferase [Paenibacillus sp. HB172176]|uniref:RsmB/NOP family class I SAM-dependent RNA methyltransferase n=1 Tax=Paenibacillus sp. HB172176 TaxID=2493690 RepID=UPI00143893BB|nr:RsmB/NOP family class I SAM-dependent RNA methyltransferase [Paenibacillus sp. HB172176]
MKLPSKFLEKMKALLRNEYEAFLASYEAPRVFGIRVNPLKLSPAEWRALTPMNKLREIPWTDSGFYYEEGDRPGKHPHYHAGLYYIQEPSAMLPVELLDVRPGHRVLDLCAAPGGKSTQIAGKLLGDGVLVANDNAAERTKALAKNIELAGVRNAVITNEEPSALKSVFSQYFDRILVDAPCSGEGMFRKEESMAASWEKHSVEVCSTMQRTILEDAAVMLAPGGLLVYSTCTFSPEENEDQIAVFLSEHPEFHIEPMQQRHGLDSGHPEWLTEAGEKFEKRIRNSLRGTVRVWPHRVEGEGHYVAVLRKEAGAAVSALKNESWNASSEDAMLKMEQRQVDSRKKKGNKRVREVVKQAVASNPDLIWKAFAEENLKLSVDMAKASVPIWYGSKLFLQPPGLPPLDGLRVNRAGWYAGEARNGRFVPSQALAMGLKLDEASRTVNWRSGTEEIDRYLRGETLFVKESELRTNGEGKPNGYVLVCVDGFPLGWGKLAGDMLKNELSTGWRRL